MIIEEEINNTTVTSLYPPLDETSLVQALVAHYLAHDGYIETARAFSEEVRNGSKALESGGDALFKGFEAKEDLDAVHRQRTSTSIAYAAVVLTLLRYSSRHFGRRCRQGL